MRFVNATLLLIASGALAACSAPGATTGPTTPATSPTTHTTGSAAPTSTGATATQTAPSSTVDACELVSAAEIETAVGSAVQVDETLSDAQNCFFKAADGTPLASVIYLPEGALAFDTWAQADDSVAVPGVGDAAVFNPQTGLIVKTGNATVSISLPSIEAQEDAIAAATTLIQLALSRL